MANMLLARVRVAPELLILLPPVSSTLLSTKVLLITLIVMELLWFRAPPKVAELNEKVSLTR